MKKIIFVAAALLGLAACNKETVGNIGSETSGKTITLTATVNVPSTKVAPDTPITSEGIVSFHWQENDSVLLVGSDNISETFTIINSSISADGKTAQFTGTALSDMSSYTVFYAGKNTDADTYSKYAGNDIELDNVSNGCNVVAVGKNGNASGFTLSTFSNAFRLKLKGEVTLGKVEYWRDSKTSANSVINFGTDGLSLTSTAQEVWIPVKVLPGSKAIFRFYDKDGKHLMNKTKTKDFASAYGGNGCLISFPELEVKSETAPIYTEGNYSGNGIKIGFTWWAPVNCGYDATHTYGLLYQWGRKYGQAYEDGTKTPETLTKEQGNDYENREKFGKYDSTTYNWFTGDIDQNLWPEGSKGTYDPCPDGWRVPTKNELEELFGGNKSGWTDNVGGQKGCYFNGTNSCTSSTEGDKVFLPAAGLRDYTDGAASGRDMGGYYWSSKISVGKASCLSFYNNGSNVEMADGSLASGRPVRCVKE